MAVNKQKKREVLSKLEDKFQKAKVVYFAEYSGIPVKNITEFRKKLYKANVDYIVAKKTLIRLAAKNQNLPEIDRKLLSGPVAAIFGYDDVVMPSKLLAEFGKTNEGMKIIGGIMDGKILSMEDAQAMSKIPSKQELLAKLLGSMKAPISGFHGAMHGLLGKFVRTIDAIRVSKS